MKYLINQLLEFPQYKEFLDSIKNYTIPANITGPSDSQKAHICYALCEHSEHKGIFIAYNEMQARRFFEDFSFLMKDDVLFFPAKEIMLHDVEAKSYDAIFQRIVVLDNIVQGKYKFIVTSAEAMVQKLIPKELFMQSIINIKLGDRINLMSLIERLVAMGYERVASVEGKGQFAIRGGIIDVFSIDMKSAIRMELFDDEIDSIRYFDVLTQRSVDKIEEVRILPAREVIYGINQKASIASNIKKHLDQYTEKVKGKSSKEHINQLKSKIQEDIEKLKSDHYFPGVDRLIPYIIESPAILTDYMMGEHPPVVFIDEEVRVRQRVENIILEHQETCKIMLEKGNILPASFDLHFDYEAVSERLDNEKLVNLSTMPVAARSIKSSKSYGIVSRTMSSYQGHLELLIDDIKSWKEKNYWIIVLAGTSGRGQRLSKELAEKGVESIYSEDIEKIPPKGQVFITRGSLYRGFEYPTLGMAVVSDREVMGQGRKASRASGKKEGNKLKAFTDLNQGDYVVHQTHGIGQYVGIQQLAVDTVKRDYLKIRYQDQGYIYIPTNQLDLIQKYIGSEGKAPKLSKLGGSEWLKTKNRVKESLKELAGELIKLYAQRRTQKGFSYSADTVWQKEFEEAFPYEETEDQLKCIEEIKRDMESDRPMDRLLCGDVGYGKTEVAIRGIFKAAMDGKQVAYLVPTTILAQQHYNNFKERMKEFPIKVEVISRFRTPAEQKKILKDVKVGNIDVLIGTHRLIQKDIQFKDLGLLVVDEEQRFGVTHKERLKSMKSNVDTLTLTATPIPRTLHMSLVGIRDISVLEDPPEERYPVQTYVMEYNSDVIKDAIIREMSRKGQVFYLYNRVRSIQLKAAELQALVPDARIEIAHGQMAEGQLETIMNNFINGEYDILVCTTIIESGLDMPNVNTIIVEDADNMGLAQLYQIRGRVGRSNKLAYAYITYKKDKILSEIAEKRLQAIKEFTEFGSGFKIAMRDLEIRGAGNVLGPEQHGHMEAVGYDMYCKLLDETVRELSGETPISKDMEVTIDINVSAYIDNSYIGMESHKIEMYKKIASIQDEQDMMDVEDELVDRYGDPPPVVRNLIQIAYIKSLAGQCGFMSIQEKNGTILLQYRSNNYVNVDILGKLMDKYRRSILFTASNTPYLTYKISQINRTEILDNIKILLQDINKLQTGI